MYLHDLEQATEIVLSRNRVRNVAAPGVEGVAGGRKRRRLREARTERGRKGSAAAAGAIRVANVVGAAMTNHRVLGPAEGGLLLASGLGLLAMTVLGAVWPRVVAVPIAAFTLWLGIALTWRAFRLHTHRRGPALQSPNAKQPVSLPVAVPESEADVRRDREETRP
jgi:cardiolipin synthase